MKKILAALCLLILLGCQDINEKDSTPVKVEKLVIAEEQVSDSTPEVALPEPEKPKTPSCGDTICNGAENKCTCAPDCGRCDGFASNLTQYVCVSDNCVLRPVENICGNAICEAGEKGTCISDCPDCADGNACTVDSYDGTCKHTPVAPCCGNGLCETGEDNRCIMDCVDPKNITLANYPYPFVNYPDFNANFIVGNGSSALVVSNLDILRPLVFQKHGEGYSPKALLANQTDSIANKNVILTGNACQNRFVKQLLIPAGNPDCTDGIKVNQGLIRLHKTGDETYALIVAGYAEKDTRAAAQVLSFFNQTKPSGIEVRV